MLISQDDSLIFANDLRWGEKHWSEPDFPDTSELFGSHKIGNEPTQIDSPHDLRGAGSLQDHRSPSAASYKDYMGASDELFRNNGDHRTTDHKAVDGLDDKPTDHMLANIVGQTNDEGENTTENDDTVNYRTTSDHGTQTHGLRNELPANASEAVTEQKEQSKASSKAAKIADTQVIAVSDTSNALQRQTETTYYPGTSSRGPRAPPDQNNTLVQTQGQTLDEIQKNSVENTKTVVPPTDMPMIRIGDTVQEQSPKEDTSAHAITPDDETSFSYLTKNSKDRHMPADTQVLYSGYIPNNDTQKIISPPSEPLQDRISFDMYKGKQTALHSHGVLSSPNPTFPSPDIPDCPPLNQNSPDKRENKGGMQSTKKHLVSLNSRILMNIHDIQVIVNPSESPGQALEEKEKGNKLKPVELQHNNAKDSSDDQPVLLAGLKETLIYSSPCRVHNRHTWLQSSEKVESDKKNTTNNEIENSVVETEFHMAQDTRLAEPTTQVLNTQQDVYNQFSLKLVNLGSMPVRSTSQSDSNRLASDLSIVSMDDDAQSEVEEPSFMCEDSIFNHKKRKLLIRDLAVVQTEEESSSVYSSGFRAHLQTPSDSIHLNFLTSNPRSSEFENRDILDAEHLTSQTLANIASLAQFASSQKTGSSSSELEDLHSDISDLKNVISGEVSVEPTEGISQEVCVSRRRKDNSIPETHTHLNEDILRGESLEELTLDSVVNGRAVWKYSLFRNIPGMVVSIGEETSLVLDGNAKQAIVRNSDLNILDIRIGDFVLLALQFGQYVVTGLSCLSSGSPIKCIRGYDTVFVRKNGKQNAPQGKELRVPLQAICMEVDQWAYHQLQFRFSCGELDLLLILYYTAQKMFLSNVRSQGACAVATKCENKLKQHSPERSGVFADIIFFVTYIEEKRKKELQRLITFNGGTLIDDEIDLLLERTVSGSGFCALRLKPLENFKFGALLSDGYSRRPKYLQALALGWPILADAFVEKTIENPELLDQWPAFLLPAGMALAFNGTKSHDVFRFRTNYLEGQSMSGQLSNNAGLMAKYRVLILQHRQDKKVLNMCGFTFHAFGVKSVMVFPNCSSIERHIRKLGSELALVYDNNDRDFQKTFGKKRRRNTRKDSYKPVHKVGVIDWEWVVQSVISNLVWKPVAEVVL